MSSTISPEPSRRLSGGGRRLSGPGGCWKLEDVENFFRTKKRTLHDEIVRLLLLCAGGKATLVCDRAALDRVIAECRAPVMEEAARDEEAQRSIEALRAAEAAQPSEPMTKAAQAAARSAEGQMNKKGRVRAQQEREARAVARAALLAAYEDMPSRALIPHSLEAISYRELQALAKQEGLSAHEKRARLVEGLSARSDRLSVLTRLVMEGAADDIVGLIIARLRD
jgi:hypothetical protein